MISLEPLAIKQLVKTKIFGTEQIFNEHCLWSWSLPDFTGILSICEY